MKAKIFNIQKFSLHDGAGIRTCVFFSGCNLRCKWCANPECRFSNGEIGKVMEYDPHALLEEVLKDKSFYDRSGGGVTLTGGEIFCQYDFIRTFCQLLRKNQMNIAIETSGAVDLQRFADIAGLVDFIYIDCKHYNEEMHKNGTGVSLQKILNNIRFLAHSQTPYCVRIPVIPGYNDALTDADEFAKLLLSLDVQTIELLPFHQLGENKYNKLKLPYSYAGVPQLHKEDLLQYAEKLKEKGLTVILK